MPDGQTYPGVPAGVTLRDPDDYDALRGDIQRRVRDAYLQRFPIENDRVRLELRDAEYDPKKLSFGVHDARKALLEDGSLRTPLRGTFRLTDKATGQTLDEKRLTFANVPTPSHRGTFIVNGTEYAVQNQQRLKPGIYARRKDNGDLESHCFHHTVKVWTEQGLIPIGKIVNQRMQVRVWSYDFETKQFSLKPIVNWYRNKVDGLGCSFFEAVGRLPSKFRTHPTTLWSTPDHQVYLPDGQKQDIQKVSQLTMVEERMTPSQEQMIWGSMLGDGHINDEGLYQEAHSVAQKEYTDLKGRILGPLVDSLVFRPARKVDPTKNNHKKSKPQWYLTSKSSAFFRRLRSELYMGRTKIVPREWLEKLDERALAFWFCDDGSSLRGSNSTHQTTCLRINIATQSFPTASVDNLIDWLRERWGVVATKDRQAIYDGLDYGWFLLISSENAEKFLDLVSPYIHTSLRYKLSGRPITGNCSECFKEIDRRHKFCNACHLSQFVTDKTKSVGTRFKSRSAARFMIISGTIPEDKNLGDRWDQRDAMVGTGLLPMEMDCIPELTLVSVPHRFEHTTGTTFDTTKTAYDIEVEGTHNYFANGVLVSNCNVKSGTGPQMRLFMEPDTGIYRLSLQQSQNKLYPIAKAIGIKDEELSAAWGPAILQANQEGSRTSGPRTLGKFYQKLLRHQADPAATPEAQGKAIAERFAAAEFDPEVNQRTLGRPHRRLTNGALLDASTKLLKVHRGEAEGDDRDSLANKTFHSADDFLEERVQKDAGRLGSSLLWKAGYNRNLDHLRPGHFTPQLQDLIVGNSLSGAIPGINAMELRDANYRITSTGDGGVGSASAISLSSRNVSPTHYGFIDPIRSSESHMIGVDLRLARKIKKGSDHQVYAPFRNKRTGQTEWLNPSQLAGKSLGFADADTLAPHATPVVQSPPVAPA